MGTEKDGMMIKDNVMIVLRGPDGKVKHQSVHNVSTTAGRNAIADQILAAPTLVKPTHMAIGTGSPGATLLGAEVARVAFTSKTRSGAVVTMVADYAAGIGTGALTEVGIFNVITANTVDMYFLASFAVVNKLASDSLSVSWSVTFS